MVVSKRALKRQRLDSRADVRAPHPQQLPGGRRRLPDVQAAREEARLPAAPLRLQRRIQRGSCSALH
eukprot:2768576-Prymnesium_polylepis.1